MKKKVRFYPFGPGRSMTKTCTLTADGGAEKHSVQRLDDCKKHEGGNTHKALPHLATCSVPDHKSSYWKLKRGKKCDIVQKESKSVK